MNLTFFFSFLFHALATEAVRSMGCFKPSTVEPLGIYFNQTILSGGINRTYHLSIPSNYDPKNKTGHPLVVFYHGWGGSGYNMYSVSNWSNPLINPDAVVVYPDGYNQAWQGAPYAAHGVNDILFTRDLLRRLKRTVCLDKTRFYAVGFSNGGGFTNTMACDPVASKYFAAFAPSSGAFYRGSVPNDTCTPGRSPVPIMELHGLLDFIIPYIGGYGMPAITDWISAWTNRNGCSGNATFQNQSLTASEQYYDWPECSARHYVVNNGYHSWFGDLTTDPLTGAYKDAVSLITDFFYKYTYPSSA